MVVVVVVVVVVVAVVVVVVYTSFLVQSADLGTRAFKDISVRV